MKTSFSLLILIPVFFQSISYCQPKINIVHPKENDIIIASDSTYVYGNMWPKQAKVVINSIPAETYNNGTFMGVIPVQPGVFTITAQAIFDEDSSIAVRKIFIPHFLKTTESIHAAIDTSYVFPREHWTLKPGDVLKVAVKGTPDCQAFFKIGNLTKNIAMTEIKPQKNYYWGERLFDEGLNYQMSQVRGIYTGSYEIQPWDWGENLTIKFFLRDSTGKTASTIAPGKITIDASAIPKIAEFQKNAIYPRSGTSIGTQLFFFRGTRAEVLSQKGKYAKISYSNDKKIWVRKELIEILPPGSTIPEALVSSMKMVENGKWNILEIDIDQNVPVKISEFLNPARIVVRFFNARLSQDTMRLAINNHLFSNIHWEYEEENLLKLTILMKQKHHWGFDPYFRDGKFYLKIKKQPKSGGWLRSPLKDLIICLDPGHSPDLGAIGPSGMAEKDINFIYCNEIRQRLEKKGAKVFLTRTDQEGISLQSRVQFAKFIEADIFLSIHFNGMPDGIDPFPIRGIAAYYNQPHSYRLAALLYRNMLKKTRIPGFGLYYSNLFVCRIPQTISVLLEPGFLTNPAEEIMITSKTYREQITEAIVSALEQFIKERQ